MKYDFLILYEFSRVILYLVRTCSQTLRYRSSANSGDKAGGGKGDKIKFLSTTMSGHDATPVLSLDHALLDSLSSPNRCPFFSTSRHSVFSFLKLQELYHMMTNETQMTLEQPLGIDDMCDVRWRGGDQTLKAVIIERRPLHFRKRKSKKDSTMPPVDHLKPDEVEYYVHYVDQDRYV